MPWKACYLICFLVCVLLNAKREKGNTEVFYCPPLSSFLSRVEKKKQVLLQEIRHRMDAFWTNRKETWRCGANLCLALHAGVEIVLLVNVNNTGLVWFGIAQALQPLQGRAVTSGQLLCATTDSSSTGSALPPHISVMGSVQNFNQKLVELRKNLLF